MSGPTDGQILRAVGRAAEDAEKRSRGHWLPRDVRQVAELDGRALRAAYARLEASMRAEESAA